MRRFNKIVLVLLCLTALLNTSAFGNVTLRFWDKGEIVYQTTAPAGNGQTVSSYMNSTREAELQATGKLQACDGYSFYGWNSTSLNAEVIATTAPTISTFDVVDSDIDFYAVFRKEVTYYSKITSTSDLVSGSNYLIVGENSGSYYAMGNTNISTSNKLKGVEGVSISVCNNDRVYNPASTCVWQLSGSNNNWTWRNQGNTSNYLRLEVQTSSYGLGSNLDTYYNIANTEGNGTTVSISDDVVTIEYAQSYGFLFIFATANNTLFFTPSTTYFGGTRTNVFMAADYNNNETDWNPSNITKGNIYLYKQATEYRYLSHCDPYSLQFKACGDNTCGSDFTVSPTLLTEAKNAASCTGLWSFAGVNPNSVSPTIGCTARWNFAGWATVPCADKTEVAPTMVSANPYVLNHHNDTLYAVYRHKTNGTPDYYSSYPNCTLWTVWFDPVYGKIGGSSSAVSVTETVAGNGVTTPSAQFNNCNDWDLAGWLDVPCESRNSAPTGMKSAGTYYPQYDGERLYAVYKKGSVWTSYPLCDPATITLNAGTGLVHGTSTHSMTEGSAGAGIVLNEDASFTGCNGAWTFVGWSETQISGNTAIEPTLIASGSTYYPKTVNSDILYAVYRRGTQPNQIWTSLPSCATFSVTLHACGEDACAYTSVQGGATYVLNEASLGSGVEFPSALVDCSGRWTFAGWQKGSPVDYQYTLPVGLYASGATYNPSQDGESFYAVYRHTTDNYWTSSPDCTPFTVHLHACEGLFSTLKDTLSVSEENAGDGIELPAANPLCGNQGWKFKGWATGELRTTSNLGSLTLYNAGDTYYPSRNDVDLYAVYELSKYVRVTERSQLNTTDSYVIAFYWDYGAAFDYSDFAVMNQTNPDMTNNLNLLPIYSYTDDNGQVYVANPANDYLWKLSANNSTTQTFKSVASNQYIYSDQGNANLFLSNSSTSYVIDFNNSRIYRSSYNNNYRYWHFTRVGGGYTSFYAYQDNTKDDCYLYRPAGSSYSSWPHCAEYTVYFNGCDGIAGETSIEELEAGKGVEVPGVSQICDDWTFVGWSTEYYNDKTRTLAKDLYPQGSTFIPESNNIMLYAVYAQLSDTFDLIGNSDLQMGVNYLVVNDAGERAMGNTHYDTSNNRQITSVTVTDVSSRITSNNTAIRWRITEENEAYIFYNPAANKYLDLVTKKQGNTYYPSVQTARNDAFTITSPSAQRFNIMSNNVPSNRKKYLTGSADNRYFDSNNNAVNIRLYKQRGTYCSYPCSKPIDAVRWDKDEVWVESIEISGAPTAANLSVGAITAAENGTYNIKHTAKPGNRLRIAWGGNYYTLTVPYVATPSYIPDVENYPAFDFIVGTGVTYTITKNTRLHTLTVYDNARLVIGGGMSLTVDTLILRSEGDNAHPIVQFGSATSSIVVNSGILYHDRRIDYRRYYMFALPFASRMSDIRYHGLVAPSGLGAPAYFADYFLQYYDGAQRAIDAAAGDLGGTYWTNIPEGDAPTYSISAGKGFALGIRNPLASEGSHDKRTLRFKMTPAAEWNDTENGTTNKTTIVYTQTAASDELKVHTGWNLISNPYMHNYYPGTLAENSGLLNGHFEEVNGKWVIVEDGTQNVPYMTFYDANIDDYTQIRSDNTLISPFNTAFVQVAANDMLLFSDPLELRPRSIVARRNRQEEKKQIVNTGVILEQNGNSDCFGLVIGDKYTSGYDIGGDLEKKMNPNRLHAYAILGNKLAFCAIDETTAALPIPVGVSVPQAGSYTFRFDEWQYDRNALEALSLTDYETHQTTNLLDENYTCYLNAGVHEDRFAINAVLKEKEVTTDIESVTKNGIYMLTNDNGSITICSNDKLTNLVVHDVTGRLIGRWTLNNYQWTMSLPQGVYAISVQSENNGATVLKVCTK